MERILFKVSLVCGLILSVLFSFVNVYGQRESLNNFSNGKFCYLQGRFDEAISAFGMAIEEKQNIAEAFLYRGNAYSNKAEFGRAISDYSKAIELRTDFALAYYNRAVAHFSKQEYGQCWQDVHKAQELGFQPHYYFIGQLREDSGRVE